MQPTARITLGQSTRGERITRAWLLLCLLLAGCAPSAETLDRNLENAGAQAVRRAEGDADIAFTRLRCVLWEYHANLGRLPDEKARVYTHAIGNAMLLISNHFEMSYGLELLAAFDSDASIPAILHAGQHHAQRLRSSGVGAYGWLREVEEALEGVAGTSFAKDDGTPDFERWWY